MNTNAARLNVLDELFSSVELFENNARETSLNPSSRPMSPGARPSGDDEEQRLARAEEILHLFQKVSRLKRNRRHMPSAAAFLRCALAAAGVLAVVFAVELAAFAWDAGMPLLPHTTGLGMQPIDAEMQNRIMDKAPETLGGKASGTTCLSEVLSAGEPEDYLCKIMGGDPQSNRGFAPNSL
jgi:hypothetical protein